MKEVTSRMLADIVKVTDAKTGKLKRWENAKGKPLAIMSGDELVLTSQDKWEGYSVSGKKLISREQKGGRG